MSVAPLRRLGLVAGLVLMLTVGAPVYAQNPAVVSQAEVKGPTWIPFPEALTRAGESGKKVLVDVWSARCGWCARMQREVYPQTELMSYLEEHFETGRLDIDVRTDTISYMGYDLSSAELSVGFGATGTPTTVFLGADGAYITRLPGFHNAESFLEVLRFIGSEAYRDKTFEEYKAGKRSNSGR